MTNGTKPTTIVVRAFRGQQLYLRSVHTGNGMHWTNDQARALKLDMDAALAVSERASREWGTQCAVEDSTGTLARDANSDAAANALSIFRQLTVNGRVDHKALLDEVIAQLRAESRS